MILTNTHFQSLVVIIVREQSLAAYAKYEDVLLDFPILENATAVILACDLIPRGISVNGPPSISRNSSSLRTQLLLLVLWLKCELDVIEEKSSVCMGP